MTPVAAAEPTQPGPAVAEDPQRAITHWVLSTLTNAGYRCNEDSPALCQAPDDEWSFRVAVTQDGVHIVFDSFATRAPWASCASQSPAFESVRSQPMQFYVDCNDTGKRIRFSTAIDYRQDLNLTEWLEQHRRSRYDAYQTLNQQSAGLSTLFARKDF